MNLNQIKKKLVKEAFHDESLELNELEFIKEKETIVESEAPMLIETVLPGWDEWAGEGLETIKTKSNTIVERKEGFKPSERQDFFKTNVIINENIEVPDKYKSDLPYGFTTKDYNSYVKVPISLETNSLRVFNKFVKMNKKPEPTPGVNVKPNVYQPEY